MTFEIKVKIGNNNVSVPKDFEKEISESIRKNIKKIVFLKKNNLPNKKITLKELRDSYAGIFPAGIVDGFLDKNKIDEKNSYVYFSQDNKNENLEFVIHLPEKVAKEFENDPIEYTLKKIGKLDPNRAAQIFDEAIRRTKK